MIKDKKHKNNPYLPVIIGGIFTVIVAVLGATLPVYLPIINDHLHISEPASVNKINEPENNDNIKSGNILLTGTLADSNDGGLWIIVKPNQSDGGFWPMKITLLDENKFTCETILGGVDSYSVSLIRADNEMNDYLENYLKTGKTGSGNYDCLFDSDLPGAYIVLDSLSLARTE